MAYKKENFKDGDVLEAKHLNKIEDGIEQLNEDMEILEDKIPTFRIAKNTEIDKIFIKEVEQNV